jgi:hypothetical protein
MNESVFRNAMLRPLKPIFYVRQTPVSCVVYMHYVQNCKNEASVCENFKVAQDNLDAMDAHCIRRTIA